MIYDLQPRAWKDGQGCLISIIGPGEPCPIFSAAPGGVSGQPGNNGSYAPVIIPIIIIPTLREIYRSSIITAEVTYHRKITSIKFEYVYVSIKITSIWCTSSPKETVVLHFFCSLAPCQLYHLNYFLYNCCKVQNNNDNLYWHSHSSCVCAWVNMYYTWYTIEAD